LRLCGVFHAGCKCRSNDEVLIPIQTLHQPRLISSLPSPHPTPFHCMSSQPLQRTWRSTHVALVFSQTSVHTEHDKLNNSPMSCVKKEPGSGPRRPHDTQTAVFDQAHGLCFSSRKATATDRK
jgi:hypothetical protein